MARKVDMASSGSDQFFEEEGDLAQRRASQALGSGNAKTKSKAQVQTKGQKDAGTTKPPTPGLVVAIAVVALLLGIGIGYCIAMAVVDRPAPDTAVVPAASQAAQEEGSLPSGHPDIASMMNPDGSVNQEAVDAFKASRAGQDSNEDAQGTE